MRHRSIRQPIPLRRSSSLCTERGSILSSVSRSNSLVSNSATVGSTSLGFPTRTESPVEHPTGLDYPWEQTRGIYYTQQDGAMYPFMVPIRPDSCPPDTNAYGVNIRTMDMVAYPGVASPTSSDSSWDSDSDRGPSVESEPNFGSARRHAMVLDPNQLAVEFDQLHTSQDAEGPWSGRSQVPRHGGARDIHGDRQVHRGQRRESHSRNVRFAEEDRPVLSELHPAWPVGNHQQPWSRHQLGGPREPLVLSEAPIYPINTALDPWDVPRSATDHTNTTSLAYGQHQYPPPNPHRSATSKAPNSGAHWVNPGSTKPLLGVSTRAKKQVRISPIVDFAPTSLHDQEPGQPSSPSGYSSVSESIAGPQTPPNDIHRVQLPAPSKDIIPLTTHISHGDYQKISRQMSITEIIARLVKHGCHNLTSQLDKTTFGQFPVANGGFSDVYQGYLQSGQQVAIKLLRVDAQSLSQNPKHLKHAARELHTWSKCNHPNVLHLFGLAIFRDRIGMVSPWMDGGSLTQYLRQVPDVNRCYICAQIAGGLAYMHGIGITHGDIKGANVLISKDGTPVLTDFGNSHLQERTLGFTQSTNGGSMTLRWSAPEVINDMCTCEKSADIYALGMTILEVLTGEQPYHYIKNESSVMLRVVMNKELPLRPEVIPINCRDGNRLWDLLVACWSYKPEARPSGVAVFNTMASITPQGLTSW